MQLLHNDRYRVLRTIQAGVGLPEQYIGEAGRCRFCGRSDGATFRTRAHTFPEALGNRWVFSRDECDDCNRLFGVYEDALVSALRPFLTLGGVSGKNGVPQTGRSAGNHVMRHDRVDGRRRLLIQQRNVVPDEHVRTSPDGRHLQLNLPVEAIPFRPRRAYKALSKIGLSLLPVELLPEYSKLLGWLQTREDQLDFPVLEVGLSFGSIGNALPVVCAALLQRVDPADPIPHLYLLFCAGSICAQMALMSDRLEDHLPPTTMGSVKFDWAVALGPQQELRIDYGQVWPFNWASPNTTPQPVESFTLDFDIATSAGTLTPRFRPQ